MTQLISALTLENGGISTTDIADNAVTLAKANADFYQTGTWTPSIYSVGNITGGTGGVTINSAKYVKVGKLCQFYINATVTVTTGGSSAYFTFTTPFTHDAAASPACGGGGCGANYYPWSVVDEGGGDATRLALVTSAPASGVHSIQFGGFFFTS